MEEHGMEREEYQRLWAARLTDLAESGMTQRQWCEQNGISFSTLKYWILKANKKPRQNQNQNKEWLALEVGAMPETADADCLAAGKISVNYGGFRVDVGGGTDPGQIFNILRMIKEL
jgi:hypothetical protein